MPSIYDIKPAFQKLWRPLVQRLAAAGITANQVTIFAGVLSGVTGAAVALQPASRATLLAVPAVLFLRMALNAIDGMLAREHDMKTALGAVLNELGDVLADAALYLPFALVPGLPVWAILFFVILGIISEMSGVVSVQIGASRRYDGPMGKSDRAFALGLLALLLGYGVTAGRWMTWYLIAADMLLALTIWNRARKALAEVRTKNPEGRATASGRA